MDKNINPEQNERTCKDRRFETIFNKYYYLVLNITEEYLGYEEALDICQESFFTLYLRYDLSLPDEELKALLIRIATTKSIDYYRKRNRESKFSAEWCYEKIIEHDDFSYNLEWDVITRDFYRKVLEDIKEMRPEWAEVLLLHSIFQFPQEEVAKMMNIPITALRSRLNRARNYLKTKYGDELKHLR